MKIYSERERSLHERANMISSAEKRGMEIGIEKGKAELLIKQLMKKFKGLPEGYKHKIKQLPEETLELVGMNIFDLESLEDLERYL